MQRNRILTSTVALLCLLLTIPAAMAAEVDCDGVYCFSADDFSAEETLQGICLTELPDGALGAVKLGSRVLCPGDILTESQLAEMTFSPLASETDHTVSVSYLPIYEDRVEAPQTMTISIRGREDQAPVAEDSAHETYKNLPLESVLKVQEPERQAMRFTVVRSPRRGSVTIREDGHFTYTPKKNKVGVDSFTYTVTDPAGNVSREATVTIQILKPGNSTQYTDTVGYDCRFAAEWMKNTGIFVGEQLGGNACFSPDSTVSRGEFLAMLVKALEIPLDEDGEVTLYTDEIPTWLQPYLAAALRSGLTTGLPQRPTFDANEAITGGEAAVMLQNALDLSAAASADNVRDTETPAWSQSALDILNANGLALSGDAELTRANAAMCLYQASLLADSAPGMRVLRAQ